MHSETLPSFNRLATLTTALPSETLTTVSLRMAQSFGVAYVKSLAKLITEQTNSAHPPLASERAVTVVRPDPKMSSIGQYIDSLRLVFFKPDGELSMVYRSVDADRRFSVDYQREEIPLPCMTRDTQVVFSRLAQLLIPDPDDEESLVPSQYALDQTFDLLQGTATLLDEGLPRADVSVDDSGGIRVQWLGASKEVRLVMGSSNERRHYIYHQDPSVHAIDWNVNAPSLGRWINWYLGEARVAWE